MITPPLLLLLFSVVIDSTRLEDTSLCAGKNVTSEYVHAYCVSQQGYLIYRCCRSNDNQTFIAVDLMDSNLKAVPDFSEDTNFNLSVIDLRANPQLQPSRDDDFLTLTYLDDLILPDHVSCPGGDKVWQFVNRTDDPAGNRCTHQKDFCTNSTDICVEQRSYCSTNGPNHYSCLCKDDYRGYKCLRNGKFPSAIFFGSTGGATVLVSVLLYCAQRRAGTRRSA